MKKNKNIFIIAFTFLVVCTFTMLFISKMHAAPNEIVVDDFEGTPCYYYNGSSVVSGTCGAIQSDYPYFQRKTINNGTDAFCEDGNLKDPDKQTHCTLKTSSDYRIGYIVKNVYDDSTKKGPKEYYWTEFLINRLLWSTLSDNYDYRFYGKTIPLEYFDIYNEALIQNELYSKYGNTFQINMGQISSDYTLSFTITGNDTYDINNLFRACKNQFGEDIGYELNLVSQVDNVFQYAVTIDSSFVSGNDTISFTVKYDETRDFYTPYEYDCGKYDNGTKDYQDLVVPGHGKVTRTNSSENTIATYIVPEEEPVTIKIEKLDAWSGIGRIDGAKYYIYEGEVDVVDINENDCVQLDNTALENGTYYKFTTVNGYVPVKLQKGHTYILGELAAPGGYILDPGYVKFTINDSGNITNISGTARYDNLRRTITLYDRPTEAIISKISTVNGEELPGANLQILDSNKEEMACMTKDEDGSVLLPDCTFVSKDKSTHIYALSEGKYYLKETIAPEGYVLSEEMVEFEIKADGTVTEVTMENDLEAEVPDTLSARSAFLLTIAMVNVALGVGILTYVKKNKMQE